MDLKKLYSKSGRKHDCYCAFCKSPRKMERKKHISWINVLLAGLFAFVVMWVAWFELNPKALVVFVMALMVSEVFVQIRWRITLVCPHCQFDPLLYLKSPERAAARVRKHFESIQDSPSYVMGYHPLQKLMIKNKKKSGSRRPKPERSH